MRSAKLGPSATPTQTSLGLTARVRAHSSATAEAIAACPNLIMCNRYQDMRITPWRREWSRLTDWAGLGISFQGIAGPKGDLSLYSVHASRPIRHAPRGLSGGASRPDRGKFHRRMDLSPFDGACYKGANWVDIGDTAGRRDGVSKRVFLYPLCRERYTVFLVGGAHPTKTSIPARSQACGYGVSQRDAVGKRAPPGRNDDQGPLSVSKASCGGYHGRLRGCKDGPGKDRKNQRGVLVPNSWGRQTAPVFHPLPPSGKGTPGLFPHRGRPGGREEGGDCRDRDSENLGRWPWKMDTPTAGGMNHAHQSQQHHHKL